MARKVVALIAVATLSAACGGSEGSSVVETTTATTAQGGDEPSTVSAVGTTEVETTTTMEVTTTTVMEESVADAISIEPMVDVRLGAATVFSPVTEPAPVAAGDVVRTDGTGFAEIAYFDGSRTRLDVDTEFEVLELVDDVAGSTVRTKMSVGRTWHRVEELGEGGEFSVETSVATAVVQGTAFSVGCATEQACTFMVVEGALRVDLPDGTSVDLVAPAALVVDAVEGLGAPVPVPFDGAFGDEWLFDNADRDVDAGFLPAAEVYQAYGPSYGSISGTFTGTITITDLQCETVCIEDRLGVPQDRSYTFAVDCSGGVPCTGTIDTEYSDGEQTQRTTVPISFDGTSFRWVFEFTDSRCVFDNDGDGTYETPSGEIVTYIEWVMTPSAAEIVDDRWVVTAMADTEDGFVTNTVTDPGLCGDDFWAGDTSTAVIEVTRVP